MLSQAVQANPSMTLLTKMVRLLCVILLRLETVQKLAMVALLDVAFERLCLLEAYATITL
ncbi:hypothetical protein KSX_84290 [Ktedonospora formicarum]|uniref:Uncharacterized protein n=1 Tax=Ktedonospora formicarum TaxID=2778364 RepID=A0A8J3IA72_9CHLR|nr:hypothetical protein KSX_84290 [Ktedonospora formicarum]